MQGLRNEDRIRHAVRAAALRPHTAATAAAAPTFIIYPQHSMTVRGAAARWPADADLAAGAARAHRQGGRLSKLDHRRP